MPLPFSARINFSRVRAARFSTMTHQIYNELNLNAGIFPALPVALATLLAQIQAYDAILGKPLYATKTVDLAAARKVVAKTLRENGIYINIVANGDKAILEKTAYPLSKDRLPIGALPMSTIEATSIGGGFMIKITRVAKARGYLVLYFAMTPGAVVPANFKDWSWRHFPNSKGRLTGLQSSVKYRLVSVALGTHPALSFSNFIECTTQ